MNIEYPFNNNPRPINERLILESYGLVREIKLDIKNAVPVLGGINGGEFQVGNIVYEYNVSEIPPNIFLPGDKEQIPLIGNSIDIGFTVKGTDKYDLTSNLPKKDSTENLIKIYSTVYKIIYTISQSKKPSNILVSSYDKSGYFGIYNILTKTNKLPSYSRKTIIKWEVNGEKVTSIVLKRV